MYEHIFGLFRGIRYIANPASKYIVQYHFQNCEIGIGFLHECIYRAAYHSKFTGRLCGCHHQSNTSLCGQQFCTCGRQCIGRSIEHRAGMYQGVLAVVFMFLPILIECLLWQMTLTVCAGIGDVFDLKEITSILNAASKVMSMMLAILLCTMAMMTISTVVVLMMGGAVQ